MTLDEKLDIFYNSSIEKATNQSIEMINEYKESLKTIYEEHVEESKRKADVTLHVESENLIREKNRQLSSKSLDIRRDLTEKTSAIKEQIFEDVQKRLVLFMDSPEYVTFLEYKIMDALAFARGEDMTIYINPSDTGKKTALERATHSDLTVSNTDFMGGIRAIIHSRHLLMDYSFTTKLAEAKDTFTLN